MSLGRTLMRFAFLAAIGHQITYTFVEGGIFEGTRGRLSAIHPKLDEFVHCHLCVGTWSGIMLASVYRPNLLADAAILRAVIGLGNTLGLLTIGEGIERAEQLAALNTMGCHAGQGFYLSRPLTVDALDALLAGCLPSVSGRQLPPAWKLTA